MAMICTDIVPLPAEEVAVGVAEGGAAVGGGWGVGIGGRGTVAVGAGSGFAVAGTARGVAVTTGAGLAVVVAPPWTVRVGTAVAGAGLAWGRRKSGRFTVTVQPAVRARHRPVQRAVVMTSGRLGKMLSPSARSPGVGMVRRRAYDSTAEGPSQVGCAGLALCRIVSSRQGR